MSTTKFQPVKRGANLKRLNNQQRMFVQYAMASPELNTTDAARQAGYKNPTQAANKLLNNPVVKAHLGKELALREERVQLTADRVLVELARIGFSSPKRMVDSRGMLIPLHELPDDVAASIASMEVEQWTDEEGQTHSKIDYKFWNKNNALELLAKHLRLLSDKLDVQHSVDAGSAALLTMLVGKIADQRNIIDSKFIESRAITLEG